MSIIFYKNVKLEKTHPHIGVAIWAQPNRPVRLAHKTGWADIFGPWPVKEMAKMGQGIDPFLFFKNKIFCLFFNIFLNFIIIMRPACF